MGVSIGHHEMADFLLNFMARPDNVGGMQHPSGAAHRSPSKMFNLPPPRSINEALHRQDKSHQAKVLRAGATPLSMAIEREDCEMVHILLNHGAVIPDDANLNLVSPEMAEILQNGGAK